VDFDGAGPGTCLIWHLSYEGEISGLEMGLNAGDLEGDCFALSNSVEVIRTVAGDCQANGGELIGGPFEFCAGDQVMDTIAVGAITLANSQGSNSQWVITDEDGNILGLPSMPSNVDFEEAGVGICFVWHLSYEDDLVGLEAGANVADLEGCFDFSNSIEVVRSDSEEVCNITSTDEELLSSINIYPNPTSNFVNVNLGDTELGKGTIEILDYQGRLLIKRAIDENTSEVSINTEDMNNGIYIISIRTNENYISKKLIVSR
ncbi:MAG: T9SS type A sorting domain-containing protein, partial [Bacteroidota bacterium]